uniref:C2H2-type domain-containing protein n=1 Tax=Plectus sambesii TaxID=2011161 RepID=A0A914XQ47_9BILA
PLAGSRCQLCLNQVQKSDRLHHIYEVHLAADDLFKCAECNFASGCSLEQVANHMKVQHARGEGEVLSRVEELSWKISQFETACYSPNSNRLSRQCNTAFIIKNFCTAFSRACKGCGDDKRIDRSRMKEHIWKHHLPTLPFCCAYCAENRFELRAIRDHVAKYHKSETPIDPPYTDKSEEMKEEMIQQFIRCFGD